MIDTWRVKRFIIIIIIIIIISQTARFLAAQAPHSGFLLCLLVTVAYASTTRQCE